MAGNPPLKPFAENGPADWGDSYGIWDQMTEAILTSAVIAPVTRAELNAAGHLAAATGVVAVDAYMSTGADTLETIGLALDEGRVIFLTIHDESRPITIAHQSVDGGTDTEIDLDGDANITLVSTRQVVAVQRVGNRWVGRFRSPT
ncbi:MAG: hypothetical protein KDH19_09215, partial [Geminicoccaceae bacterium]|nr:hypothetical protein [Geminicoccaceae bacterium]